MKRIWMICGLMLLANCAGYGNEKENKSGAFNNAEYMPATSTGQKKAAPAVKGTLSFDSDKKSVDFLSQKGGKVFSIPYDSIKSILYENTSKPRYAEAVLISPLFLLTPSKKHFLTIQYSDASGTGQFVIVRVDKRQAREAVETAKAQTGKPVEQVEEK